MSVVQTVLEQHQVVSHGLTAGSPDTCSCGVEVYYAREDCVTFDVSVARHRAFAFHQAEMLAKYKDSDGDAYAAVPASLVEDLHYHFHCYDDSRSRSNAGYHLIELANKVSDLASWHPGYDSDSGTMPYEREDI